MTPSRTDAAAAGARQPDVPSAPRPDEVRIRFLGHGNGMVSVLELDVPGESRHLDRVRHALAALKLRVLSSQSQRIGNRSVHWVRVVQLDGSPIPDWREAQLIATLKDSLHAHHRSEMRERASSGFEVSQGSVDRSWIVREGRR